MCTIRTILIAEDDDNDFIFVQRALHESGYQGRILRANDGSAAIELLNGICAHQFQLPAVALIDLKMPRSDGFDVLTWKQAHRHLPCVPLIVFSSSRLDADVKRAYELGAHAFSTKPFLAGDYVDFCASLQDWWRHCELAED